MADPTAASEADPTRAVLDRDSMTQAVRALPTRQREVVVLRFVLDLSVSDTAVALGCSEGTVKSYTSRALLRLRDLLDDHEPASTDIKTEAHDGN